MTLSVVMYTMMMTTLVVLVGMLVVDAVRDVLSWSARRTTRFGASRPIDDGPARGVRCGTSAAAPRVPARSAHR